MTASIMTFVSGCGGGDASAPQPAGDLDVPPALEVPDACASKTNRALPVLALEWDRSVSTFCPLGTTPDRLAIDYDVAPLARTDRLNVEWNFDQLVTTTPYVVETSCPDFLNVKDAAAQLGEAGDEQVVTAEVTADGSDGDSRVAELSFSSGSNRLVVDLAPLPDDGGDWWLLFEPAAGTARLALAPVTLGNRSLTINGLPALPGEVALVQSDVLRPDPTGRIVYAPNGFASRWRELSSRWYGGFLTTSDAPEQAIVPAAFQDEPRTPRDLPISEIIDAQPVLAMVAQLGHSAVVVAAACPASALHVAVLGFGSVSADGVGSAGPGETLTVPVECARGAESGEVSLDVANENGRRWPLRLWTEEVER